jgi:Cys-rich protein (TIGR04453 family)
MRKKISQNRTIITLSLWAAISLLATSQAFGDGKCQNACNDYVKCAAAQYGKQASAKEKKTLYDGCMMNCNSKKHGKAILQCYTDAQKSESLCKKYNDCVINKLKK